jgi:thiosulfate reductase cytochrome b subunit
MSNTPKVVLNHKGDEQMTGSQTRLFLRWTHIICAALIGTFIYSPWSANPTFSAIIYWAVIPLLTLTGLAMWKQAKLMSFFKKKPLTNAM